MIKKKIDSIINSNGLISINKQDFGDIKDIVYHHTIVINKADDFKLKKVKKDIENVKELIVHIFSHEHLKIKQTTKILDEIRKDFNHNINIIFGLARDKNINNIVIDLFGK